MRHHQQIAGPHLADERVERGDRVVPGPDLLVGLLYPVQDRFARIHTREIRAEAEAEQRDSFLICWL